MANLVTAEAEAESLLGAMLTEFGYKDGCVVLTLSDGRQLTIGSDYPVWYRLSEFWVQ